MVSLLLGDCLVHMRDMESNSVDSIITDPPYGISFMNKQWDYDIPSVEIWKECLRILKPGGHLLSFGGSRTFHRIAVNIEDAGFDIRDTIMWVYGSGFPKSHNIGKAIDKKLGNEREVLGISDKGAGNKQDYLSSDRTKTEAGLFGGDKKKYHITKGTSEWEGWGTALKPAHEPIIMARKPFKGDVASNVLQYGTGAINIDECRVGDDEISTHNAPKGTFAGGEENRGSDTSSYKTHVGRWPANFIHDGSEEVVSLLPENSSKFFYCAKTSKKDREENNNHPTVKPTELMRYLCKLITPKNGIVLDPFMGSGSTGKAALKEGFSFIGIEMDEEYFEIAKRRAKDGK